MKAERKCLDCGDILTGHNNPTRCQRCAARQRWIERTGKPPERLIAKCEMCDKEFTDYASNRRKSKHGFYFCSSECRATWTGLNNSLSNNGDGVTRSKAEKDHIDYVVHVDRRRKGASAYYWKNRDKILEQKKRANREVKEQVIDAYGGACQCCGEATIEFLTIDHINNDGALHRRNVGKGRHIYKDLIKLGFPKDNYRLLCFNCNIALGFYGYCPHHPELKANVSHVPFNPGRKRTVK